MAAPAVKQICKAIVQGMALGLSLDESLERLGVRKTLFNKYQKKKKVKLALIDGESLYASYWRKHIRRTIERNHVGSISLLMEINKVLDRKSIKDEKPSVPKVIFEMHQK